MSEKIPFRDIWHAAGISGIVLAAISSAYFVFNQSFAGTESGVVKVLNTVLDLGKIVACIYLMNLYLKRFHKDNPAAGRSDLRKLGTMIALLSATVYAAVAMAYIMWHPEIVETTFAAITTTMGSMLDANSRSVLDFYKENFARITFFSQLVYCFLFGWILTCILVPRIISGNPFDGEGTATVKKDEEKDEDSLFE